MKKIIDIDQKKEFVRTMGEKIPAMDNYKDLLLNMTGEEWEEYRFFNLENKALAGVSPEDNFNIYGIQKEDSKKALKELFGIAGKMPSLILGQSWLNNSINKLFPEKVRRFNPYFYMAKAHNQLKEIPAQTLIRKAKSSDHPLIENWYKIFNEEQKASWDIPSKEKIEEKNLYLKFDENNNLLAGCANTLLNQKRFWIGRLYVFAEERGKGHSKEFMKFIESEALSQTKDMALLVNSDNQPALALYRGLKYQILSENAYWVLN